MTRKSTIGETLLTEHDVAEILNVSVATIRRRRLFRKPPNFIKIGTTVRYTPEAVRRLVESNVVKAEGR